MFSQSSINWNFGKLKYLQRFTNYEFFASLLNRLRMMHIREPFGIFFLFKCRLETSWKWKYSRIRNLFSTFLFQQRVQQKVKKQKMSNTGKAKGDWHACLPARARVLVFIGAITELHVFIFVDFEDSLQSKNLSLP